MKKVALCPLCGKPQGYVYHADIIMCNTKGCPNYFANWDVKE